MTRVLLPFERTFKDWIDERGMRWERIRLRLDGDGSSTNAYRFSLPTGAKATAVALHGAGNDALFAWVGLFKRLLLGGTEVFTIDLPGHGRRNRTRFTVGYAIDAVETALDRCADDRAAVPVHAIGVSLGGAVLLGALPRLQQRLTSAALLVTPLHIELSARSVLGELTLRNLGLVWRERDTYGWTGLIPSFGPFKRDVYPLRLAREVAPGPFGYVETLNRELAEMRLEEAARAVRIPALVISGGRDRIVPAPQSDRIARLIPTAERFTVPDTTHLSTPLDPRVMDRLLTWVDAHD